MALQLYFDDTKSSYSVELQDDDRVGWAYLRDRALEQIEGANPIISDVWLYNVAPTPSDVEEARQENAGRPYLPMLNSAPWVRSDAAVRRLEDVDDVMVRFVTARGERIAEVSLDGVLEARLSPGQRPGWSRLARQDGPCARVLDHSG